MSSSETSCSALNSPPARTIFLGSSAMLHERIGRPGTSDFDAIFLFLVAGKALDGGVELGLDGARKQNRRLPFERRLTLRNAAAGRDFAGEGFERFRKLLHFWRDSALARLHGFRFAFEVGRAGFAGNRSFDWLGEAKNLDAPLIGSRNFLQCSIQLSLAMSDIFCQRFFRQENRAEARRQCRAVPCQLCDHPLVTNACGREPFEVLHALGESVRKFGAADAAHPTEEPVDLTRFHSRAAINALSLKLWFLRIRGSDAVKVEGLGRAQRCFRRGFLFALAPALRRTGTGSRCHSSRVNDCKPLRPASSFRKSRTKKSDVFRRK